MLDVGKRACAQNATWWIQDKGEPSYDHYTLACDDHKEEMAASPDTLAVYPYEGIGVSCCHLEDSAED